MSAISAAITKYEAMAFPVTKPPIYFEEIPQRNASGTVLNLPYVRLRDLGTRIDYPFEYQPMETSTIAFDVYAIQLSDADAVANGIKYGTSASTQAGFDFTSSLTMTPLTFKHCMRTRESRRMETVVEQDVKLVHVVTLEYEIQAVYQW